MPRFASSVSSLRSSEIRDLMSVAAAPDIISFSGGMPGNDLFPLDSLDDIYRSLTDKEKQVALQYGPTNGLPSMLESLEAYLEKKGLPVKENRLMMTTGSLQAIHILAKAFINPGDTVLVENPSFIGALSAFRSYEARLVSVHLQMRIDIEQLKIGWKTPDQSLSFCIIVLIFTIRPESFILWR